MIDKLKKPGTIIVGRLPVIDTLNAPRRRPGGNLTDAEKKQ